ncbi:MAG: decaprenyl-phosphate phosphoribosyltransferase [Candidatus Marinimicrobia bacterium]|nr:decaprenyl-phosphate phosphoribosyltransferase [Candidatus Neomarinimicrobiota bacterium]
MRPAAQALVPWLRALRPKQWTKNAVVLAAYFFALGDTRLALPYAAGWRALAAAGLFCLLASAVYLANDVRDRARDQAHPTKRLRPIAAGQVPVGGALFLAGGLALAGLLGAVLLGGLLPWVFGAYILLQVAYTLGLKHVALLDLFVIAAGFVLRALSGAVALPAPISPWLLLCAFLLALFLALGKRRHEKVVESNTGGASRPALDGYSEKLLDQLIGIVCAAVIVSYALYTLAPETVAKFGSARLGLTVPFVVFGLFRYLDLIYRHEQGGRPEQILLTDRPLLVNLALYGLTVLGLLLLR